MGWIMHRQLDRDGKLHNYPMLLTEDQERMIKKYNKKDPYAALRIRRKCNGDWEYLNNNRIYVDEGMLSDDLWN